MLRRRDAAKGPDRTRPMVSTLPGPRAQNPAGPRGAAGPGRRLPRFDKPRTRYRAADGRRVRGLVPAWLRPDLDPDLFHGRSLHCSVAPRPTDM